MQGHIRKRVAILVGVFSSVFFCCTSDELGTTESGALQTTNGGEVGGIPSACAISPPSPNPVSTFTTIRIAIPRTSNVLLVVQNPVGDPIKTLLSGQLYAGYYHVIWNATSEEPGYYFVTLNAGPFVSSQLAKVER